MTVLPLHQQPDPVPTKGNWFHRELPYAIWLTSYAYIGLCFLVPKLWAGFPFLCLCCEGFYTPFHWFFVSSHVKLGRPYKVNWLVTAFAMELPPLLGVNFFAPHIKIPFEEPFGLPIFAYSTYLHLAIHIAHALYVMVMRDPPELYAPNPFYVNWPGRIYVFYDATVHTTVALRFIYICHPYVSIIAGVVMLSALMEVSHTFFLETPQETAEREDKVAQLKQLSGLTKVVHLFFRNYGMVPPASWTPKHKGERMVSSKEQ
jgi:hypothetical protein